MEKNANSISEHDKDETCNENSQRSGSLNFNCERDTPEQVSLSTNLIKDKAAAEHGNYNHNLKKRKQTSPEVASNGNEEDLERKKDDKNCQQETSKSNSVMESKRYKMDRSEVISESVILLQESLQQIVQDSEERSSLQVIDVRSVVGMMKNINEQIKVLRKEREDDVEMITSKVKRNLEHEFNLAHESQEEKIKKMEQTLQDLKKRNQLYEDILQFNGDMVADLSKRMDAIELSNAKKTAIVSGLKVREKKKDIIEDIKSFIHTNMVENPEIEDAYSLGRRDRNTTIVVFSSIAEKERIFQQKGNGEEKLYFLMEKQIVAGSVCYIKSLLPSQ